jgi:hypothetical protein
MGSAFFNQVGALLFRDRISSKELGDAESPGSTVAPKSNRFGPSGIKFIP